MLRVRSFPCTTSGSVTSFVKRHTRVAYFCTENFPILSTALIRELAGAAGFASLKHPGSRGCFCNNQDSTQRSRVLGGPKRCGLNFHALCYERLAEKEQTRSVDLFFSRSPRSQFFSRVPRFLLNNVPVCSATGATATSTRT